jgi:DNA-binding NtrC family response regulator
MVLSSLKRLFFDQDYDIHTSRNGLEALELLRTTCVHAALIDLKMPEMDGLTLLREIRRRHPTIMCMMLTGHGGVREAVEAIKLGALDFLEKPYLPDDLCTRVAQLHRVWTWRAMGRKRDEVHEPGKDLDFLVGSSGAMTGLKEMIVRVAPSDSTVLVTGETGTGKELVARALHQCSARSAGPFVPVDCSTLNETVIESELFGHVKGAFTGAHASSSGLFVSADGGTLFLDEVGELPLALQPKLLRAVQEKEVRPVGGAKGRAVDVRIVAATNRSLEEEVSSARFRQDLYYRLSVVTIQVPALRDRRVDIPLLVEYFMEHYASEASSARTVSPEALELLRQHEWPGNVRELENAVQRALALARGETVLPEDLPARIRSRGPREAQSHEPPSLASMMAYERSAIENALRMADNNRRKAAGLLGIGEATLYRKIKKYLNA